MSKFTPEVFMAHRKGNTLVIGDFKPGYKIPEIILFYPCDQVDSLIESALAKADGK